MKVIADLAPNNVPWERYWATTDQTPLLADAFLIPPQQTRYGMPRQTASLNFLAELQTVPCLVLLGSPGLGKSRELTKERDRLMALSVEAGRAILHVDLKTHGQELFREAVFASDAFTAWARGESTLTLLLDSLDECWEQIRDLIPTLVLKLKPMLARAGHPALTLRLGCRAAEWRSDATAKLEALFGKPEKGSPPHVQIHQLAPLTRDDVSLAAKAYGLADPERFLEELTTHDLNALAAHPLTLGLLLADKNEGRPLGPTRADVYRRGMLRLAHDPHEEPGATPRNRYTTPESRRMIAGRLAAHGVLSRRYLHRLPNSIARPALAVLEPRDLINAGESGPSESALPELGQEALRETYRCGLFRGAGDDCVTWQHQAYAEFLAAEFLTARKPVRNENLTQTLLSLVSDVGAVAPRIYPPLEELALWLVELHPPLFDRLLPGNADVLVRCNQGILTEARRAQVVDLYFEQVRRNEAEAQDGEATLPLGRLKHPTLLDQLRRVVVNRAESATIRRTAVVIAEACGCRELADDLIEVIFCEGEDVRITHAAAWQLRRWEKGAKDAPDFATKLRERLLAAPERADLEVLGCVLPLVWPGCLSTEELLPFLSHEGEARSITSYDMMLHSELIGRVRPEDVPKILRWAAGLSPASSHYHTDRQAEFIQQVVRLAFSHLDDQPDVLPALTRLATSWSHYERPPILSAKDAQPFPEATRRRFWSAFLSEPDSEKVKNAFSQLTEPRGVFFVHDDLGWAVGEAVRSADSLSSGRWENLVSWLTSWEEQADIEMIWPLVEVSDSFAKIAAQRTSCQLVEAGEPNWKKRQFHRTQKAQKQKALAPVEERFSEALGFFAQGQEHALWWAAEVLFLVEGKDGEFAPPYGSQEQPTRDLLTSVFHTRLGAIARSYLAAITPPTADELIPDKVQKRHVCVVRLAGYLSEQDFAQLDALPDEWWRKWLPALLVYHSYAFGQEDSVWNRIFEIGHKRSPEGFHEALRRWLKTEDAVGIDSKTWFGKALLADAVIRGILRKQTLSADTRRSHVHAISRMLLNAGDAEFEKALADRMTQRGATLETCHPHVPMAAALLLSMRADRWAASIAEEMAGDPVWARAVLRALNTAGSFAANWITFLTPDCLARLWETLRVLVPKDSWEAGNEAFVTVEHEVAQLQGALLNQLDAQTTLAAVSVLEKLIERRPADAEWLGRMLAHVRRAARREGWLPMEPQEAARFLKESGPRPVRNLGDLCDAVMASLEGYQAYLRGPNRPTELWNERKAKKTERVGAFYEPKDENVLSNCLVTHLRRDLGGLGVWGEREVEVRRGTATEKGDNPDIVIIAPNPADPAQPLRLYIEVKCAWNVEAISGMGAQLFDRYLRTADCGIYVLAHYACKTWDAPHDSRRKKSLHRIARAEAEVQLEAERRRIQTQTRTDKRLAAFFLDASL